jgi:hypothetical protein
LRAGSQGAAGRPLVWSLLGLTGLLLLTYGRVILGGETFAMRDHLTWTLPSRAFLAESLRRGHLPEWWDRLRLGERFAADPNNGVTYPPAWLVALGDPLYGADLVLLLHVLLIGFGAWLLARRVGARPLGAFFGASGLMLSGYVASMPVNGSLLMAMGWMPLLAWAALGVAQAEEWRLRLGRGLVLAAVLAGSVASGNPAGAYNVLLAGALVVLCARRRRPALVAASAAGLLGSLMGAASIVAPLVTLQDSERAGGLSLGASGVWSMHPLRLLELAWPDLLGHGLRPQLNLAGFWVDSGGLGGAWSASDYVGLPLLVCVGVALFAQGGLVRRLGWLSLAFLLLALGTHTPLYGAYRSVFRFERILRYPEKYLAAVLVLWSALAAVGFDHIFGGGRRWRRLSRGLLGSAALLGLATGLGYALEERLRGVVDVAARARDLGIDGAATVAYVLSGGVVATTAALLVGLALWLRSHERWGRLVPGGFVVLAVAQLVSHDWSVQVLVPRAAVREKPALLRALPSPGEPPPRLVRRAREETPSSIPAEVHALYLHQLAKDNGATRFGFAQLPGYDIAGTPRFGAFATASGQGTLERIMDLLDIRYLLIDVSHAAGMGMTVRSPGSVAGHVVLENSVRRPRAFVAYRYRHGMSDEQALDEMFRPDAGRDLGRIRLAGAGGEQDNPAPPTVCEMDRPNPEHVVLLCRAAHPGYAVLVEEWTEGWTAAVDGHPAPIERADVVLRAVAVPAGEHRVEMHYRTPGLRLGAWLALVGWLLFLGAVGVWLRLYGSSYRPESPSPTSVPQA